MAWYDSNARATWAAVGRLPQTTAAQGVACAVPRPGALSRAYRNPAARCAGSPPPPWLAAVACTCAGMPLLVVLTVHLRRPIKVILDQVKASPLHLLAACASTGTQHTARGHMTTSESTTYRNNRFNCGAVVQIHRCRGP